MLSSITARGQTVIPAEIRDRFHLSPSERLEWVVEGDSIRVYPVKNDPIAAFRGRGKGGATARLIAERQEDSQQP
jgi:AbrB family looped-hinge helix DNA binding protein